MTPRLTGIGLAALLVVLLGGVAHAQNPTAVITAPAQVSAGQPLVLDGARSFDPAPGRIVRYTWTNLTRGTPPVETAEPRLTIGEALAPGRHQFQLVVTDDAGNRSQPTTAQVIVADTAKPTAVITAPTQVSAGQPLVLDGARSFDPAPGRVVRYTWTNLTRGTPPIETTEPRLTISEALAPGRYQFQLVVTDDAGNRSDPTTAQVIVADTAKPTAVITAPAQVSAGQPLVLDGARSFDPAPGRIVRYTWTNLTRGTPPVETAEPRLTISEALAPGRYQFQLVVTDDAGNRSQPTTAQVIVADTAKPTAVITAPTQVSAGQPLVLDGARSFDPAPGRVVRYTWTNVTRKTRVVTTDPRLTVKETLGPGRYEFQLVVTDDAGNESQAAAIDIVVTPARRAVAPRLR